LLTSKIGTGKRLICGPSLVTNYIRREKISLEDSVKMPMVSNACSFGKGTVCAEFSGMRDDVARMEGKDEWMDGHSHWGINLGVKYSVRSPSGVMLEQGINMNP
jgi:hypothetical protein